MQRRATMGSISGAQASIYIRAKQAVDQALPLLDSLAPLNAGDGADLEALKIIVRKQMIALVEELSAPGGPRVQRVGQLFRLLGGPNISSNDGCLQIGGTMGTLRDQFGLSSSNVQEEEQNLTTFRVMADSIISLAQSWLSIRRQRRSRHS